MARTLACVWAVCASVMKFPRLHSAAIRNCQCAILAGELHLCVLLLCVACIALCFQYLGHSLHLKEGILQPDIADVPASM